jgi:nitrogen regulatory protein P-II 1
MRLIQAIVRPDKVNAIKEAINSLQVSGMTVLEVRGHGRQKGHTTVYRGKEYDIGLLPKIMVEVVVADEMSDDVVKAIVEAARTGEIGDGRIFVMPVLESISIRTRMRE